MTTIENLNKLIDKGQINPKELADHLRITEDKFFECLTTNHFSALQRASIHAYMKSHRKTQNAPKYQINAQAADAIYTDAKHAPYRERFKDHSDQSNLDKLTLKEIIELTYIVPTTTVSFWLENKTDLDEIMTQVDNDPQPLIDGFKTAYKKYLMLYTRTIPYRVPTVDFEREPLKQALIGKLDEKHLEFINQLNEFSAYDKDLVALLNKPAKTIKINASVAHALHTFLFPTKPFTYPNLDWKFMPVPVYFIKREAFSKRPNGLNTKTRESSHSLWFKTLFKEMITDNVTLAKALAFETLDQHDRDVAYDLFSRAIKYYEQHGLELPSLANTPFAKLTGTQPSITKSSIKKGPEEKPVEKPVVKPRKELVRETPADEPLDVTQPAKPNKTRDVSVDVHTSPEFLNKQTSTDVPAPKSGKERLSSIAVYLEEALERQQEINITYNKKTRHTIIQIAVAD